MMEMQTGKIEKKLEAQLSKDDTIQLKEEGECTQLTVYTGGDQQLDPYEVERTDMAINTNQFNSKPGEIIDIDDID